MPELRSQSLAVKGIEDRPDLDLDEVAPIPPLGIYAATDMAVLIEAVYIAPYAPAWFVELVESVMRQYGRSEPVHQSGLEAAPVY